MKKTTDPKNGVNSWIHVQEEEPDIIQAVLCFILSSLAKSDVE